MCGIFLSNDPMVDYSSQDIIEESLRFRGPDCSSGLIKHSNWFAYHSRLSIIDIYSGVNQPVIDQNGGMLVFNGEILNYKELGFHYFNTEYKSDTRLLSDLIQYDFLKLDELDGFYSFSYIDKSGKLKWCVRDRFGVKPLFYYKRDGFTTISSEPSALKMIFNLVVDTNALDEYKSVRAPIFSGSFFDGVLDVEPGCCLVNGRYFDAADYLDGNYEDVPLREVQRAIEKGISTRMVSDTPVGLLLSRGVDSNLIKSYKQFDRYYSIGFEGDGDLEYLKKQSIDGLTLDECSAGEYIKRFQELLELRKEPMSVPNEVLLSIISMKAANDGVKVLLSGEGADEFFGGYDRIFQWAYRSEIFDLDDFLSLYCYVTPSKNSEIYSMFFNIFNERTFPNVFEMVRWFFIRYHMPILFRRLDFSLMSSGIEGREPIANMHTFRVAAKLSPDVLMGTKLGKLPLRNLIAESMGDDFAFESKIGFPVDLINIFGPDGDLTSYEIWFKQNLGIFE